MPVQIDHVDTESENTAERFNRIIDGVNALNSAMGNISVGPGGLSIPTLPNTAPSIKLSTVVEAGADDGTSTYEAGSIVAIINHAADNEDGLEDEPTQTAVTVEEASDFGQRNLGVVYKRITTTSLGEVITRGFALVRVVRPVDDDLLEQHGVIRLAILDDDGDAQIGIVTFGLGFADLIWEEDTSLWTPPQPGTAEHWALVQMPGRTSGAMFAVATSDEGGGVVSLKFADTLGEVHGEEIELPVIACEEEGS